jgi:hypothetical protein
LQSAIWALEDEAEIQVSWRAIRSGGRGQEAKSLKTMEFLGFSRDRIFREYRRKFLFEELVV